MDYVIILTLISLLWSTYIDTLSGSLLYIAAFAWDEFVYVRAYGIERALSHLTHVSLFLNSVFLALHMLMVVLMFWYRTPALQKITGTVAVIGSSVATLLYTASACLVSGYGGAK